MKFATKLSILALALALASMAAAGDNGYRANCDQICSKYKSTHDACFSGCSYCQYGVANGYFSQSGAKLDCNTLSGDERQACVGYQNSCCHDKHGCCPVTNAAVICTWGFGAGSK